MPAENVKAFFEALSKDGVLQKALREKELAYTGAKENREAVVAEVLIPVANEAGYDFTLEDLKAFEKSMQVEGELAEDELEAVAGGGMNWGVCVFWGLGGGSSCIVVGGGFCVVAGWDGVIYANDKWGG